MSCCGTPPGYEELDEVSKFVSSKLAAFLRTLRDNAFAVGLREGQDAAALMAALIRSGLVNLDHFEVTAFDLDHANEAVGHAAANSGPFRMTVIQPG